MGAASRFMIRFENTNVQADNYQEFGIELGGDIDTIGLQQTLAQILLYCTGACRWVSDQHTRIVGVNYRATLAEVSVPLPFPATEYAAL